MTPSNINTTNYDPAAKRIWSDGGVIVGTVVDVDGSDVGGAWWKGRKLRGEILDIVTVRLCVGLEEGLYLD